MPDAKKVMESTTPVTAETVTAEPTYTVSYILAQMEKISGQMRELTDAVQSLAHEDGDAALPKMSALNDAVKQREETNRRMLDMYEKMYDKLTGQSRVVDHMNEVAVWLKTLNRAEYDDECWQAIMAAAIAQMERHY